MAVVGSAADGAEAVEIARETSPDVVLMDLSMPRVDGVEAIRRILAERSGTAVVVLTSFSDRDRILEAIDAGAVGYLLKDAERAELLRGIRAAVRGESPLDPRAARALLGARAGEQADSPAAGHHRTHREGPPDQRLPAYRCRGPHIGRAVGPAPWAAGGLTRSATVTRWRGRGSRGQQRGRPRAPRRTSCARTARRPRARHRGYLPPSPPPPRPCTCGRAGRR